MNKVIVIGLDGFEPKIVDRMFRRGELPNLSRLASEGGYSRIQTTYPAQTPVAWSTFATGTNPGQHGIFDFLSRDPETYLPRLGLSRYVQKNAFVPPKVVNLRHGVPVWNLLSDAGVTSTVIRCPCSYPPDNVRGRMLSGVGVPDLRGGLGTSTFYTSATEVRAENSERVVPLTWDGGDTIRTHLVGPRNPRSRDDFRMSIELRIDPEQRKILLLSEGEPRQIEIGEGSWSEWLRVKFKIGLLQSIRGMIRFYLASVGPHFELYASPINFDSQTPLFPISSPDEYASELSSRLGNYHTLGMAEDHDGLINGRFEEGAFLEQCETVMGEREKMMLYELDRFDSGLFFCLFDTPDRLQHMFWRFHEGDHPANQAEFSPDLVNVIDDHYRECDNIVGKAMEYVDDKTLLIVLSDHGMSSFQRGVNLNTWLHENGFLALTDGQKPGDDEDSEFFRSVDWSRTQAYALGLGGIYLNLRGREANGIVKASERDGVESRLVSALTGLRDPVRKATAVRTVLRRDQIYTGAHVEEAPDLLANFAEGYRVSWGTPLGGVPAEIFEDNVKKWGGDHVVDPSLVPGVLLMNRDFDVTSCPRMVDMAPTILKALGIPKGKAMEGESLI